MKTMTALEVRKSFGRVLDIVAKEHTSVVISRANKPLAVMIPIDEYQARNSSRENRIRLTIEKIGEWKKRRQHALKKVDPVKALRDIRENR